MVAGGGVKYMIFDKRVAKKTEGAKLANVPQQFCHLVLVHRPYLPTVVFSCCFYKKKKPPTTTKDSDDLPVVMTIEPGLLIVKMNSRSARPQNY